VTLENLLRHWADMDVAAQKVLVATPSQMTEAAKELNDARLNMRAAITHYVILQVKK